MLSLQGYLDLLNDRNYKIDPIVVKWQDVFYGMSLHIDGVCPYYVTLRDPALGWVDNNYRTIYPERFCGLRYQYIFENKLFSRHPRESELTRQWRFSQYKPFTQAPFLQVIQVITGAIFQDSGYQITLDNKEDNDYIWGNNFEDKNLTGYLADKFQNIAEDPNGMFVVIPKEPYYKTTTKRIEPGVNFVHSKDIKHHNKEEAVFYLDGYWWAVNKYGYYRFVEKDKEFVIHPEDEAYGGYYVHMLNELPLIIAGGLWNNQGFYDSWLNAAKPVADEFVAAKSAEQLVNKEASHPFILSASEDCPNCTGGKIQYCTGCNSNTSSCSCEFDGVNDKLTLIDCNTCSGAGVISRNPGQWQIVPIEDMEKTDAIKIINPEVAINKFHAENNKDIYNAIMRALHLDYIEEAQSGTAKDKDMETRYQFLLRITNDLFDRVIPKMIYFITGLRNIRPGSNGLVPDPTPPIIIKPTQFQIKTAQDLLNEYDTATKAQVPKFVLAAQLEDYVDKLYGGNDILKRKASLIIQMDIFAMESIADISTALLNGLDHRLFQLHQYLPTILDQIIREKGDDFILNKSFEVIKAEVDRLFALIAPPVIPIQTDIVRDNVDI